jgi:hypothetical protein
VSTIARLARITVASASNISTRVSFQAVAVMSA